MHALAQFDLGDFGALFVEQERSHLHGHLGVHRGGTVFHGLFLDDAQNLQGTGFDIAHMAGATAARTRNGSPFRQCRAQALAAHLQQTELADAAELHAGAIQPQRVAQAVFHIAAVACFVHIDEIDHDQATQIAQTHLAGNFICRFQVGARGGFFDVAAANGARRVHVDRNQSLRVVDHDRAPAGQRHDAGVGAFDLVLDLETRKQRRVVAITFDLVHMLGHHVVHELVRLLVNIVGIDQDVTDFGVEIVAQRTHHQIAFLINQESAFARLGRAVNGLPQLEQIVQVPLQLRRVAANAGGARDDAHALGVFELIHCLF